MPAPVKTIHVKPGSDLEQLLEDADEAPIELVKSGVRYRLNRIDRSPESDEQVSQESNHDSILNIIGMGASDEETDVACHKHEYLAEAFESSREP